MISKGPRVTIVALTTVLLLASRLEAQKVETPRFVGVRQQSTSEPISPSPAGSLTSIYGAVIDSVVTQERVDWHRPTAVVMVVSGVYFLPWVERGRIVSASLGPVPPLDEPIVVPPRRYESVTPTQLHHLTSHSDPVFILGAVDMFDEDGCVVRVGLYQPSSVMQLFYATVRRTTEGWRVTRLKLELQR